MSISVQGAGGGAPWLQRRDATPARAASPVDVVDRDEYIAGARGLTANPYDKVIDAMRTAALRRDAAATAARRSEQARTAADDTVLAHERAAGRRDA